MTSPARSGVDGEGRWSPLRRAVFALLVISWIGLFAATHWPGGNQRTPPPWDKLAHFACYGGLALLFATWVMWQKAWIWIRVLGMVMILATFAAFDELTQPLVNRHADWDDWYVDLVGIVVGLVIARIAAPIFSRWRTGQQTSS